MRTLRFAAALLLATAVATPAVAQKTNATFGNYWEVSQIDVAPGKGPQYINYLATEWKKQQEYAKSKGYILDYKVLVRSFPRDGEADLVLITIYKDWPSQAENQRRQDEFTAMMRSDDTKLAAASADRGAMRKQLGVNLYEEVTLGN